MTITRNPRVRADIRQRHDSRVYGRKSDETYKEEYAAHTEHALKHVKRVDLAGA